MRDLPVHLWVGALVRRAHAAGAFATVVHRGDDERGDVVVKVAHLRGKAQLYAPAFNPDGPVEFERLPEGVDDPDEEQVDAVIAKRREFDRDLWVIEIEDREARHFLTERVRGEGRKDQF